MEMALPDDTLLKQYQYTNQSSKTGLYLSIFFGLLFSLGSLGLDQRAMSLIVGSFLLVLWYNNIKEMYYGHLYESRIVDTNGDYGSALRKIRELDLAQKRQWHRVWLASYFGFGVRNWLPRLIGHVILLGIATYLLLSYRSYAAPAAFLTPI